MKKTVVAWGIFFGGFGLLMGIDYVLRKQNGNIQTGGFPDIVFITLVVLLGATALWMAYNATKTIDARWKRILLVAVQGAIGFVAYVLIGLLYVVGTGIDCI